MYYVLTNMSKAVKASFFSSKRPKILEPHEELIAPKKKKAAALDRAMLAAFAADASVLFLLDFLYKRAGFR